MNARAEYDRRLAARRESLAALDRRHQAVGYARVAAGLSEIALLAGFVLLRAPFSGWWLLAPLPVLFFLGVWLDRLEEASAALSRAIRFYERGIARIDGGWPGMGPTGARFLDEHHVYARDLDIFGQGSLFDLLCNARTTGGEEMLANWLLNASPPGEATRRQDAVKELGPRLDFHEQLAVVAELVRNGAPSTSLRHWAAQATQLQSGALRSWAWVLSCVGLGAVGAGLALLWALLASDPNGIPVFSDRTLSALRAYFVPVAVLISLVVRRFKARTDRILGQAESATTHLLLFEHILRIVEAEAFASPRLVGLRAALETDNRPASWHIGRLNRLMHIADARRNWLMRFIGPLILFDLHLAWRLEDWRRIAGPSVPRWLDAVAEVEALASLAGFHFGHPEYVFPEFVEGAARFEADALGHPLLDPATTCVVTNDPVIVPPLQLLIVSGSNMSGKSTFLRTVGINSVLAQAGAPVCARRMRLSPLTVAASIRIQDSLRDGVSRFYAEILRLKQVVDLARDRPPALFLIDEFLHGTNSHDRLTGASALVGTLVDLDAIGLITTHDLALAGISESLGPRAANVHFQDEVRNGQLHYDYIMRPGIVRRSNAIELMRSIGLDV